VSNVIWNPEIHVHTLMRRTARPHAAILFIIDWILSEEGQSVLA
jgi:hypothetical protein